MDDPAGADAAFEALGSEPRLRALRALVDDEGRPTSRSFSELFEATDVDTTAGFSYHLRQLTDRYVRKDEESYELTYAGLRVARAVAAGTYTESVDSDPIPLDDDCPLCGEAALVATVADNVTTVACDACDRAVLELPFPPSGHDTHGDDLPRAFDVHHRHRIAGFSEGVCPECGGAVDAEAEAAGDPGPAVATFTCEACGARLRCPVTLATLNHPAVVAFYHDHGRDVRDRPLWNVGDEWRERVVSEEPWCVRVTTRLDDEELQLFVARDATVVEHRRREVEGRSEVTEESRVEGSEAAAVDDESEGASA
ncbi:winged helix-turn-helix domain-containing protein [Halostella salina]|uniref:winged helix-turn-helix domain-containing protein n=1 Tax=Halostella salina TaxID=1547897 RepID=UPI000EF76551|nr:winged helix-turn-helix domain-containing protein [Halostella salina]